MNLLLGTRSNVVLVDPSGRTLGTIPIANVGLVAVQEQRIATWSHGSCRIAIRRLGDPVRVVERESSEHVFRLRALALSETHTAAGGDLGELLLWGPEGELETYRVGAPVVGLAFDADALWVSAEVPVFGVGLWRFERGALSPCHGTPGGPIALSPSRGFVAQAATDHVCVREARRDGRIVARVEVPAEHVAFVDEHRFAIVSRRSIGVCDFEKALWLRRDDLRSPLALGGSRVGVAERRLAVTRCGDAPPPKHQMDPAPRAPAAIFDVDTGERIASLPDVVADFVACARHDGSGLVPVPAGEQPTTTAEAPPSDLRSDEALAGIVQAILELADAAKNDSSQQESLRLVAQASGLLRDHCGAADALGRAIVSGKAEAGKRTRGHRLSFLYDVMNREGRDMRDLAVFARGVLDAKEAVVRTLSYRAFGALDIEGGCRAAEAALQARQAGVRFDAATFLGRSKRRAVLPVLETQLKKEKTAKVKDALEIGIKVLTKMPTGAPEMVSKVCPERRASVRLALWKAVGLPQAEPRPWWFRFFERRSSADAAEALDLPVEFVDHELRVMAREIQNGRGLRELGLPSFLAPMDCLHLREDETWDTQNATPEPHQRWDIPAYDGVPRWEQLEEGWASGTGLAAPELEALVSGILERSMVFRREWTYAELERRYLMPSPVFSVARRVAFEIAGRLITFDEDGPRCDGQAVDVHASLIVRVAHPADTYARWPELDEPFVQRGHRVFGVHDFPETIPAVPHAHWRRRQRELGFRTIPDSSVKGGGSRETAGPAHRPWITEVVHTGYGSGYGGEVPVTLSRAKTTCAWPKMTATWCMSPPAAVGWSELPPAVRSEAIRELLYLFDALPFDS